MTAQALHLPVSMSEFPTCRFFNQLIVSLHVKIKSGLAFLSAFFSFSVVLSDTSSFALPLVSLWMMMLFLFIGQVPLFSPLKSICQNHLQTLYLGLFCMFHTLLSLVLQPLRERFYLYALKLLFH